MVAICIATGLAAGVLLAAMALEDTLKVTVTDQSVEFLKNQKTVKDKDKKQYWRPTS